MRTRPKITLTRPRLLLLGGELHAIHEADEWGCYLMCKQVTNAGKRMSPGKPTCAGCLNAIRIQDRPIDGRGPARLGIYVFHDKKRYRKEPSS